MLFSVRIRETQWIDVEIVAETANEAEQIAENNHCNGEYDIDKSDARYTEYDAEPVLF